MISFVITGMLFGLMAGLSPGPILTLVISETIRYGKKEGLKVAFSPLLTDLPIVLLCIFIIGNIQGSDFLFGIISLFGAFFIAYLAYESIRMKQLEFDLEGAKANSLGKGIVANFLNPHPYMFWLSIGTPWFFKANDYHAVAGLLFLICFYVTMIGSKVVIAVLVERSKVFLNSKVYLFTIRALGVVLLIFSLLFIKDALNFFGII